MKEGFSKLYGSPHLRPFLLLLLLAVIFFSPFFFQGKAFLAADNLLRYYPWRYYAPQGFAPHNPLITDPLNSSYPGRYNEALSEGHLYRWNPYVLTGTPGVPGEPRPYFPLKMLLHRLFPTYAASALYLFLHVFFMGFFMYLYLQAIGAGSRGALFGAIAYMFNGCAMVWLEFESWATACAYLPLLLLCAEKYLGEKKYLFAFAGGIVFGCMLLASNFQLTLYAVLLLSFYMVFLIVRSYGQVGAARRIPSLLICFVVTMITGLLIGAIEIIPFLESAAQSSRIHRTFDFQQFFDTLARVPFRYYVTLFFPDFYGSPPLYVRLIPSLPSQEYMNFNELTLYTGIATVFAFAACATVRKNSFSRFYLFMTLFVIAMVTGTFAYYPFFALVPGMDKTNPTRLIFLFVFVFAAAAGLGIGGLEDATRTRRKIFIGVSSLITAAVVSFSFVAGRPGITRWINRELYAEIPQAELPAFVANVGDFRGLTSPAIYQPLLVCLAVFFLFLLFVLVRRKKIVNVVFFLIAALLSYDLISFGRNYNTTVPPKYIYPTTPAIEFLLKQKGPFRVLQDTGNGLYVNTLMPYGLEEVGGYMSVYPDRVNKLMSYIRFGNRIFAGEIFDRWVRFGSNTTDFSWPVFDLMNVRYVLTAPNVRMPYKKYKLVFQGDLAIYENMQVMPRAYVVHDCAVVSGLKNVLQYMWSDNFHVRDSVVLEKSPSAEFLEGIGPPKYPPEVSIVRYTPDKVIIAADLSTNGWLVLSDTYYPGWRAEVDGKEVEIQRANCNFRAVALRAGKHRVSFTYVPLSGRVGMILTFIGLTASLAGIVIFRKR